MEDSFEQQPMERLMEMMKELQYAVDRQNTKMDMQTARLDKLEGDLTGVSNRQSISEYEQAREDATDKSKKKVHERRSSLAIRDLGKLLERNQELQVIHTPQSFRLNGKLGDILGFREYRELVQQVKMLIEAVYTKIARRQSRVYT